MKHRNMKRFPPKCGLKLGEIWAGQTLYSEMHLKKSWHDRIVVMWRRMHQTATVSTCNLIRTGLIGSDSSEFQPVTVLVTAGGDY